MVFYFYDYDSSEFVVAYLLIKQIQIINELNSYSNQQLGPKHFQESHHTEKHIY